MVDKSGNKTTNHFGIINIIVVFLSVSVLFLIYQFLKLATRGLNTLIGQGALITLIITAVVTLLIYYSIFLIITYFERIFDKKINRWVLATFAVMVFFLFLV